MDKQDNVFTVEIFTSNDRVFTAELFVSSLDDVFHIHKEPLIVQINGNLFIIPPNAITEVRINGLAISGDPKYKDVRMCTL